MIEMVRCMWCDQPLAVDAIDDCPACGVELDEFAIEELRIARAVAAAMPRTAPVPRERRPAIAAGILSGRASARRLGIGRDTFARIVHAGLLHPVPKGPRPGFRAADVEALIERGWTLPGDERAMQKTTRRRRSNENDAAPVKRIADLPY